MEIANPFAQRLRIQRMRLQYARAQGARCGTLTRSLEGRRTRSEGAR